MCRIESVPLAFSKFKLVSQLAQKSDEINPAHYCDKHFDLKRSCRPKSKSRFILRNEDPTRNIPTNTKSFAQKFQYSVPKMKVKRERPSFHTEVGPSHKKSFGNPKLYIDFSKQKEKEPLFDTRQTEGKFSYQKEIEPKRSVFMKEALTRAQASKYLPGAQWMLIQTNFDLRQQ